MGRQKQKNRKPDEHLLGENRQLKKELKHAHQEIRRLEKYLSWPEEKRSSKANKRDEEPIPNCPDCARGFLKEIELAGRNFVLCPVCNFRQKL